MLFFEEKGCWHVFFIVEQKNLKPQSLSSWIFHCGIGCKNEDRKGHSKHLSTRKRPASRAQMSQGCIGMRFASQIRSRPLSPGTFVLDISTILLRRFTTVFLPLFIHLKKLSHRRTKIRSVPWLALACSRRVSARRFFASRNSWNRR